MPWDVEKFTPTELGEMAETLNKRAKAAEKQRREMEARH